MNFNERELDIISTAMFDLMLYTRENPDSEYVKESNGLLENDEESDFNYSQSEIEKLYEKIAY